MSGLRISADLELPVDLITQTTGIFARKGAGKTYTAKRIVEEIVKARLPVVVLDPLGAWWGLRSSADGKAPGLPVVILGGEHGDVPLEATAGSLIADVVIDHPGAYVLDLSDFPSDAEQDRFATAFMQRLYRGKARKRDPLLLVVDEADAFAPQQGVRGQETMIGAAKTIARRARMRGIGSLWITQRPAILHADIRAMVELLVVLQVTGKLDREAVTAWLKGKAPAETLAQVDSSLALLQVGEFWASSPAWLGLLVRTKASPAQTFDSSKTPEVGEERVEPEVYASVDVAALGDRMRETAEEAKANDPAALRRRIAELEAARAGDQPVAPTIVEKVVEVPVLDGEVEQLQAVAVTLRQVGEEIARTGDLILAGIARVSPTTPGAPVETGVAVGIRAGGLPDGTTRRAARPPASPRPAVAPPEATSAPGDGPRVPAGPTSIDDGILAALSDAPDGRSQRQVALMVGYSAAGGFFRRAMRGLADRGLVESAGDVVRLTNDGRAAAADLPAIPLGRPLLDRWLANPRLGAAAGQFLEVIAGAYPDSISTTRIGDATGKAPAGGYFRRQLKQLRGLGLVKGTSDLSIAAELVVGTR